ncbi:hypothetical protein K435DRAFT_866083 [Dendrothele bispora CBS 962.96]|uniref:Uncharacterized protein n=1 Tax=Dendrothele bispora (strain CBS 962.96) TaxID=1314807 RepID=A0A4S8LHW4_DENBC|nr:hypothetical protein K435DRAFT_866083 [Dendrothele bispora CBS 962.96]
MNHVSHLSHSNGPSPSLEVGEDSGSHGTGFEYPVSSVGSEPSQPQRSDRRGFGASDAMEELQRSVEERRAREEVAVSRMNALNDDLLRANAEKSVLLQRLSDVSFLGIRMIQGNPIPSFGRIYQFVDEALLKIYKATARVRANEGIPALVALERAVAHLDGCFSFLRRLEVVSRLFVGEGAERERLIRVLMGNLPVRVTVPSFSTVLGCTRLPFPGPRPSRAPILPPAPPNSPIRVVPTPVRVNPQVSVTVPSVDNTVSNEASNSKRPLEDLEEGKIPRKRSK